MMSRAKLLRSSELQNSAQLNLNPVAEQHTELCRFIDQNMSTQSKARVTFYFVTGKRAKGHVYVVAHEPECVALEKWKEYFQKSLTS